MTTDIHSYNRDEITAFLEEKCNRYAFSTHQNCKNKDRKGEIENEFSELSRACFLSNVKSVLGFDIYQYTNFDYEKQNFIPYIFDFLLNETLQKLEEEEGSLFSKEYNDIISKNFISTGDGGYLIFSDPLCALVFNLHFYFQLGLFNTGHLFPKLKNYIGEIIFRSAITFDNTYYYNEKPWGKAIITNSRILSKDKLDRFLIDDNTYNFFRDNCRGIENIKNICDNELIKLIGGTDSLFLKSKNNIIKLIDAQKLQDSDVKGIKLSTYNVKIKSRIMINSTSGERILDPFDYSIGNLNSTGLG